MPIDSPYGDDPRSLIGPPDEARGPRTPTLQEAARVLADLAAQAVTEPRRFHENDNHQQHTLSLAVANVRAALRGTEGLDVETVARIIHWSHTGLDRGSPPDCSDCESKAAEYERLGAS